MREGCWIIGVAAAIGSFSGVIVTHLYFKKVRGPLQRRIMGSEK